MQNSRMIKVSDFVDNPMDRAYATIAKELEKEGLIKVIETREPGFRKYEWRICNEKPVEGNGTE